MGRHSLIIFLYSVGSAAARPQTPFFDFQAFPVPAVTPSSHYPAPQYKSYEPAYHKPEPIYYKPEPIYHKPEPVYHKPKPVYHKPEPVYHNHVPTYSKPAPIYHSADPPYHPTPAYAPKIPKVYAKHPTTYSKPAPLPGFVNLGQYQTTYTATEAPTEEAEPVEEAEIVDEVEPIEEAIVEEAAPVEPNPYRPSYTTPVAPALELVAVGEDEENIVDDVTDVEDVEQISESDKSSGDSEKPEKLVIELPAMMMEKTTRRVPVMIKTRGTGEVKRVPVMMRTREKTTTAAPMKLIMTKEQLDVLVDMAVERLQEMEETVDEMKELEEDGLVILDPQAGGDIISVDSEAALDGMNVVEFGRKRL